MLCTTIIDFIHACDKSAWTAAYAARSSRARRDRCASTRPKPTPVITVSAVATFATVDKSICDSYSKRLAVFERKPVVDPPLRRAMLFKYAAPPGLTSSTGLLDPPCDPGYKKK